MFNDSSWRGNKTTFTGNMGSMRWFTYNVRLCYNIWFSDKLWSTRKVTAAYTSQRCNSCGYTYKDNRDGRRFLCKRCGYTHHADCNAGMNIEGMSLEKLGPNAIHGQLKLQESGYADRTQVMGCLDVEGSRVSSPEKRQAWTGERDVSHTVVLWRDV